MLKKNITDNKFLLLSFAVLFLFAIITMYPTNNPLTEGFRRWGRGGGRLSGRWSYPYWRKYYRSGIPLENRYGIKGFGGGYRRPWWRSYWPWGSMNSGYFYY